ncbi:MAG: hypothetical protein QE271_13535 [Bacteriovoracaceae bacterium]|nr:hypothetical protein [Bacteriovoracaceae bacterium]
MKQILVALFFFAVTNSYALTTTTTNGFETEVYGFLKLSTIYSDKALASYNNINQSAPTHAVARTRQSEETSRLSFQAQQSRVGVKLKKGDHISGKMEFDFIDTNKSSPTVQMNPRVRIAQTTYHDDKNQVIIGQDLDLFSPVTSYTFDYVGGYFMSGNVGFFRQQLQYLRTEDHWEFGGAVGMAGNNPAAIDGDLELKKSPTLAARASYLLNHGRVGLSAIYSEIYFSATNNESHKAYGLNTYYEQLFGKLGIKSEFYYGQNLANIAMLSIGKGTSAFDAKEFGGTLTVNVPVIDKHFIFGGIGGAFVENASETPSFNLDSTSKLITYPGIVKNISAKVGWDYHLTEDLSWMTEISRFDTKSKISTSEFQKNIAYMAETGVQLRF